MEECSQLPTMSSQWGLQTKAANCYNPDKVAETINNECNLLWEGYCQFMAEGAPTTMPEPPQICKKAQVSCSPDIERAATVQCQNLFTQEGLSIPSECSYTAAIIDSEGIIQGCPIEYPILKGGFCFPKDFDPISALKNKCQELKDKGRKEIPLPCKVLPLFTGKIEIPDSETYSGSETSCPGQKLLNTPFGFGGGLGFNCPIGLPSLPKIVLPDIVIPDIILPEFNIPPFLRVKLPKIIIEDLILPDVELCDLNSCSNVFPSLNFKLPKLNLPSLDLSAPIPQLPGLQLKGGVDFPSINFSIPQINLFNLLLPELELPKISIPSPKINFNITGIDMGAIFQLIFTFILNALDVTDFGYCLIAKLAPPSLSIVYPDYYFSFLKFPKIPEILDCKDINKFCGEVKTVLGEGGWLKKAKEIETEFNKTIDKIQKELNKVSGAVNDVQATINEVFEKEFGEIIYNAILEQLAKKGLSLEDYINPKTKELDLSKIPFPGVFPIGTADKKECLPVSTPQIDIILKIVNEKDFPEKKVERKDTPSAIQYLIYVPVDIPLEIPISWPEKLKKISLPCKQDICDQCMNKGKSFCQKGCREEFGECNDDYSECTAECYKLYKDVCKKECQGCLFYELPTISLCKLNYKKEFPIKTFGFQPRTFYFDFGKANEGDCSAEPPTGGNPFPIGSITNKLNEIKDIQSEIKSASQTIIKILE
ncbi:hypothetical protein KKC00_02875, partial [Patescibacteria group bacterium]|nr:hypothetical protein [Patescibacteria group bacterium]